MSSPETLFALLPTGQGRGEPKYVAQDVFGYSFLTDVFMADYKEGDATWQGFLRPYPTPEAAKAVFEKYLANAKQDGAEVKTPTVEGADQFAVSSNIGLVDTVFRKGNIIGGANGGTDAGQDRGVRRSLSSRPCPAALPPLESESGDKPAKSAEESAEGE